jgi:hypothetical protein
MQGVDAPPNPTPPSIPAQNPLLETKLGHSAPRGDAPLRPGTMPGPSAPRGDAPVRPGTTPGPSAPRTDATPPRFFQNSTVPGAGPAKVTVHEEQTAIGQGPPPSEAPRDSKTLAATPLFPPILDDEATAIGAVPKRPTDPMPAATPPKPTPNATPIANAASEHNPRYDSKQKATSIGFPVQRNPFETQPLGIVPPAHPSKFEMPGDPQPPTLPKSPRPSQPAVPRGKNPTTPPLSPRHPTPVAPVPIVRPPAKAAPSISNEEEHTDLSTLPTAAASPLALEQVDGAAKTAEQPIQRSGGMRASEILAAIPAGDWTMSPDELVPHALPAEEKVGAPTPAPDGPNAPKAAPAAAPKGPPTGDWTISLDPETGWSEPEKLAKSGAASTSGNAIAAVKSDKPISVVQWDEKPTGIGEAKIEIDSTLMEPHKPMPAGDEDDAAQIVDSKPRSDVPPPLTAMPPRPTSGFGMHEQGQYAAANAAPYRHSSTSVMSFGPVDPAKRKKMIIAAIGAGALAVGAIVILVLTLGGKDNKPAAKATTGSDTPAPSKMIAKPEIDASVAVEPESVGSQHVDVDQGSGSAAETPKPPPVAPVEPKVTATCNVDVKSTPTGADVYLDKRKLGTTPTSFELPCATEAKLTLRKKSFPNTNKSFTPVAGKANKLTIKLAKAMLQVKVTSTPAGATITAGGKSLGVTPTTIKLPGFEPTALTLTKPGFAPDTQRVNPKQNNTSHHVTLKKGKGRLP